MMEKKMLRIDVNKHFNSYIKDEIIKNNDYFIEVRPESDPLNVRSEQSLGVLTHTPAVYIQITNDGGLYIGETMDIVGRFRGHEKIDKSQPFCMITSNTFNKSAIYHMETKFIRNLLFSNKKGIFLKNSKISQSDYNYFMKDAYESVADDVWDNHISNKGFLSKCFEFLKTSDVDYSADGALAPLLHPTNEQIAACKTIIEEVNSSAQGKVVVEGSAGTGKTVVAALMAKHLLLENNDTDLNGGKILLTSANKSVVGGLFKHYFEFEAFKHKKIGFFTSPKEFSDLGWEKISEYDIVIMCSSVIACFGNEYFEESKNHFDIVLADEAHRYRKLDDVGTSEMSRWFKKSLGHGLEKSYAMQWLVEHISKNTVLFNDPKQRLKVNDTLVMDCDYISHKLYTQLRIKGGARYAKFVDNLLGDSVVYDQISDSVDLFKWEVISPEQANKRFKSFKNSSLNSKNRNDSRLLSTMSIPRKNGETKEHWREQFIQNFHMPVTWNSGKYFDWSPSIGARKLETVGYAEGCQGLEYNKTMILIGDNYSWNDELEWVQKGDTNVRYYNKKDVSLTLTLMKNRLRVLMTRARSETILVVQCPKLRKVMQELSKKRA